MDSDAEYARRLQAEEDALARQAQQHSRDAALARQLSQQPSSYGGYRRPVSGNYGMNNNSQQSQFTIRSGQRTAVKLHHPATKNHIGESMYAHYISSVEVRFELISSPGKCLRVTDQGRVEFSHCDVDDTTSRFRFELTLSGNIYLMPSAHINKINIAGEKSWFLALGSEGLLGNSNRGGNSQWILVASSETDLQQGLVENSSDTNNRATSQNNGNTGGFSSFFGGNRSRNLNQSQQGDGDDQYSALPTSETIDSNRLSNVQSYELNPMQQENRSPRDIPNATTTAKTNMTTSANNIESSSMVPTTSNPSSLADFSGDLTTMMLPHSNFTSQGVVDTRWRWVMSSLGQEFIQNPENIVVRNLYNRELLRKVLHRSDWVSAARRYKNFEDPTNRPQYSSIKASEALGAQGIKQFFTEGYTVLRNVVNMKQIKRVKRLTSNWLQYKDCSRVGLGGRIDLDGAINSDFDVLSLFYQSSLYHIAQMLIGENDVVNPTTAKISIAFPQVMDDSGDDDDDDDGNADLLGSHHRIEDDDDDDDDHSGSIQIRKVAPKSKGSAIAATTNGLGSAIDDNNNLTSSRNKRKAPFPTGIDWIIEGFSQASNIYDHSPYTLLIGVALTNCFAMDDNVKVSSNGQTDSAIIDADTSILSVFPGSPSILQEAVKDCVARKCTSFSEELQCKLLPPYPYSGSLFLSSNKPDLGDPTGLSLRAGDAFLCTAKMAIQYGKHYTDGDMNQIVFFKIKHVDHDAGLKEMALDFIWCEYKAASSEESQETQTKASLNLLDDDIPIPPSNKMREHDDLLSLRDTTNDPYDLPTHSSLQSIATNAARPSRTDFMYQQHTTTPPPAPSRIDSMYQSHQDL